MTDLVIKNPDGSYATTDATNLKGHNWHKTIRASDNTKVLIKHHKDVITKGLTDEALVKDEKKEEAKQ